MPTMLIKRWVWVKPNLNEIHPSPQKSQMKQKKRHLFMWILEITRLIRSFKPNLHVVYQNIFVSYLDIIYKRFIWHMSNLEIVNDLAWCVVFSCSSLAVSRYILTGFRVITLISHIITLWLMIGMNIMHLFFAHEWFTLPVWILQLNHWLGISYPFGRYFTTAVLLLF